VQQQLDSSESESSSLEITVRSNESRRAVSQDDLLDTNPAPAASIIPASDSNSKLGSLGPTKGFSHIDCLAMRSRSARMSPRLSGQRQRTQRRVSGRAYVRGPARAWRRQADGSPTVAASLSRPGTPPCSGGDGSDDGHGGAARGFPRSASGPPSSAAMGRDMTGRAAVVVDDQRPGMNRPHGNGISLSWFFTGGLCGFLHMTVLPFGRWERTGIENGSVELSHPFFLFFLFLSMRLFRLDRRRARGDGYDSTRNRHGGLKTARFGGLTGQRDLFIGVRMPNSQ
jgi:hypothetical protein